MRLEPFEQKTQEYNSLLRIAEVYSYDDEFTEEELRLGAQRPLTKDEIQYYKSLCRYAYMSEQDVIDNRCEYKQANR